MEKVQWIQLANKQNGLFEQSKMKNDPPSPVYLTIRFEENAQL